MILGRSMQPGNMSIGDMWTAFFDVLLHRKRPKQQSVPWGWRFRRRACRAKQHILTYWERLQWPLNGFINGIWKLDRIWDFTCWCLGCPSEENHEMVDLIHQERLAVLWSLRPGSGSRVANIRSPGCFAGYEPFSAVRLTPKCKRSYRPNIYLATSNSLACPWAMLVSINSHAVGYRFPQSWATSHRGIESFWITG